MLEQQRRRGGIKSLYIQSNEQDEIFNEMEDFLNKTHDRYKMTVTQVNGDIKDSTHQIPDTDLSGK